MSGKLCVVFADAFSYRCYQKNGGLNFINHSYKLTPGIGYSSNLHHLIFSGNTPDDMDFFTDYGYVGPSKSRKMGKLYSLFDTCDTVNNFYRYLLHKLKIQYDNIPFCERAAFQHNGVYKFIQPEDCYVFGRKVELICNHDIDVAFSQAMQAINNRKEDLIVILEELDRLGHLHGSHSEQYEGYGNNILQRVDTFFKDYKSKYPDSICVFLSDHGMVDIHCGVDIIDSLYRHFGKPGDDYYFYNDSVYLRIWSESEAFRNCIADYLRGVDVLNYIDDNTRMRCGASKREHGDLIYWLKEGYMFNPNCFDIMLKSMPAGMHGYMEHSEDASGIVVLDRAIDNNEEISANDIYRLIADVIKV